MSRREVEVISLAIHIKMRSVQEVHACADADALQTQHPIDIHRSDLCMYAKLLRKLLQRYNP